MVFWLVNYLHLKNSSYTGECSGAPNASPPLPSPPLRPSQSQSHSVNLNLRRQAGEKRQSVKHAGRDMAFVDFSLFFVSLSFSFRFVSFLLAAYHVLKP